MTQALAEHSQADTGAPAPTAHPSTAAERRRPAPAHDAEPRRKIPIAPLVVLALAGAGFGGYRAYNAWLAKQPLEIGGTVEVRSVQAASRTGGRVLEVRAREGDRVRAGQPLVLLDVFRAALCHPP